ncbi:YeeE/YedE thiosulfate transporter family protein [Anaerosacchariphilus polymeriproducens]|uniref:Uncharacterized protein n=1 Tax=Anaerosacchariphilus polymeriproducens TaxID=1812858 RepID=A0A371AW17_9FIRM|nr:YeeE/YedE thiosulfate transporter family protein [Anaerosacchariphilus polymeriproducens]RDU23768.1 hypothetical protein DWV06_07885 [Anaerosacchariphilus polymeriproducens]
MKYVVAIILGGLLGVGLYWMGASNPKKTLNMLKLENMNMLKIYLFALGVSSVLLAASCMIGIFDKSHLNIGSTHLGVVLGALLFGLGFGWAGTNPDSCMASIGSDSIKCGIFTLIGGLTGAFFYTITYSWWHEIGFFRLFQFHSLTFFQISDDIPGLFSMGEEGMLGLGIIFMIIALILPNKGVSD